MAWKWIYEQCKLMGIVDSGYVDMVIEIAKECVNELSEKDIAYLRMNPEVGKQHFAYGMYIRNTYSKRFEDAGIFIERDRMSSNVLEEIRELILPEYKDFPLCYDYLEYHQPLQEIHCQVLNRDGVSPIELIKETYQLLCDVNKYRETHSSITPEYSKALGKTESELREYRNAHREEIDKARVVYNKGLKRVEDHFYTQIAELYWDFAAIRKRSKHFKIPNRIIDDSISACRKALIDTGVVIPSSHVLLYHENQLPESLKKTALTELALFIKRNYEHAGLLPSWLFERRCFVEAAVREHGEVLSFAVAFQNDFEIVSAAVSNMFIAIKYASPKLKGNREILKKAATSSKYSLFFENEELRKYNNDEELVRISLEANGANIAYAADHFKDDYDIAKMALENIQNIYPTFAYESLSERLRDDKSLALLMIKSGRLKLDSMSDRLRDDDEIAEIIWDNRRGLYDFCYLSDRIRKKYGVEE